MTDDPQEVAPMVSTSSEYVPQELDTRAGDGVEVSLLWFKPTNCVFVAVHDTRTGESFTLDIDPADALDAFQHPYAYAAFRGVDYDGGTRNRVAVYA
jgi:hypothetical protein